jgi:hypothetical protein
MRKKAFVITLALVLAFASSAMAAVSFSGKFKIDFARNFDFNDNNNLFDGTYTLTPTLNFGISASSKGESEDRVDWEFSSGVKLDNDNWTLSKYKLGLYDQYFKAWVWGAGAELSDKATQFGWISAPKAAGDLRSRVEVPVADVATVTADFEGTTMRLFVDGAVEGYNVGAAYELAKWEDEDNRTNRVVVQADGSIPAGDLDIALKAAVGIDVKKEDSSGFAFGVDATVNPTDALSLNVVVKNNDKWAAKGQTDVTAAATYTEAAFQLKGEVSQSFVKDGDNKPGITLTGFYRMSDTLNYGDLFNKDKWYTNDAPAFGVKAELSGANFSKLTIDATAPVVADVASVKAKAIYEGKSEYNADVLGRIVATSKLTLSPQVKFTKTAADDTLELKLGASYRIGDTGPSVTFGAETKTVTDAADAKTKTGKIFAGVEVAF